MVGVMIEGEKLLIVGREGGVVFYCTVYAEGELFRLQRNGKMR